MNKSEQLQRLLLKKESILSQRAEVLASDEYKDTIRRAYELETQANALFGDLSTKEVELEILELEKEVTKEILESGKNDDGFFKLKKTQKKKVNPDKVLEVLGGDFGMFSEVINISQKTLKDYGKATGIKFKDCVEVISEEVVGVKVI